MAAVLKQLDPPLPQPSDSDLLSFMDGHFGSVDVQVRKAGLLSVYYCEDRKAWISGHFVGEREDTRAVEAEHPTMRHALVAIWRRAMDRL